MPLKIHHIALVVSNLARAEAFYSEIFGLSVTKRGVDAQGQPRSVWLGLDGAILMLEKGDPGSGYRGDDEPGWHCIAFAMEENQRNDWKTKLAAASVPVERETEYSIYFRDPERNRIALSHFPKSQKSE